MSEVHVAMAANGRLVVPARLRTALGLEGGGALVAGVVDGAIRLEPLESVLRRVQAEVRQYVPVGTDLAEELGRERRRAAADE